MKLDKIDALDLRRVDDVVVFHLEEARALIADGRRWWGRGGANYDFGQSFCAIQAIRVVEGADGRAQRELRDAALKLYRTSPEGVNDRIGHAAVMGLYDHAIATNRQRALAKLRPARVTATEEDLVVAGD